MSFNQDNSDDRKKHGRNKIRYKLLDKHSKEGDIEFRDKHKQKKRIKSQLEELRQEEIWEEWEDEVS
jgi:hypothetical protein